MSSIIASNVGELRAYEVSRAVFASNVLFPEVRETSKDPRVRLEFVRSTPPYLNDATEYHSILSPDGTVWTRYLRTPDTYVIEYPQYARFDIAPDYWAKCYVRSRAHLPTVRHLWLDQVLPLLLSHDGELNLHASCVLIDSSAAIFLGRSGQGKSTIAAAMLRRGCRLLADDSVVIESQAPVPCAVPSYPMLRLWPDAANALRSTLPSQLPVAEYTTKLRLPPRLSAQSGATAKVRAVYMLGDDTKEIAIKALSGAASFAEIASSCHSLGLRDSARMRAHFKRVSDLAARVACFRVDYPRRFSVLDEVASTVIRQFGSIAEF